MPPVLTTTPPRLFKVLSIDGGGIKGVYTAAMLRELEHALARQPGSPRLHQYFDLICGTSTGALIALALAAGRTCDEILTEYLACGPEIFHDLRVWQRWLLNARQMVWSARYDNRRLRQAVETLLGDTRMSAAQNYVLIPVTNMANYSPRVFKTRHCEQYFDRDSRMADVALASAAAPTFFPLFPAMDADHGYYADGGLAANNPTLLGLFEAYRVFVGPSSRRKEFDELAILSLGTFGSPQGFARRWFRDGIKLSRSAWDWMRPQRGNQPLLNAMLDCQTESTLRSVRIVREFTPSFVHYSRLDGVNPDGYAPATPKSEIFDFSLSDARPATLRRLLGYGQQDGQSAATVASVRFFFHQPRGAITLFNPTTNGDQKHG